MSLPNGEIKRGSEFGNAIIEAVMNFVNPLPEKAKAAFVCGLLSALLGMTTRLFGKETAKVIWLKVLGCLEQINSERDFLQ